MTSTILDTIEAEIDASFADNQLAKLPFAQCAWTLLSVVEDHHFKFAVIDQLDAPQASIYVDGLMNALTYPLRVCHQRAAKGIFDFPRAVVDAHYELANAWIDRAEDYSHFCTIFPLYHAREINLVVRGDEIVPTDWSTTDLSYEVYDRFIAKRDPAQEVGLDPNPIRRELVRCMSTNGGTYSIKFTRRLMECLSHTLQKPLLSRHSLPENWRFSCFTLGEFRTVFSCLQAMSFAWFAARQIAAADGAPAVAFASAVWTPKKEVLLSTLVRHTGIQKSVVADVLRYLTFGEANIRNPDIAIQPIVDLSNGQYAISSFVMTHVHAERNLCVLLNQIPEDRKFYSQLVDEKEQQARSEAILSLAGFAFDFKHGQLGDTDLDFAIIDHNAKQCLCIEIKWFIEPAEVREILARSDELRKGVVQALKIATMFKNGDARLMSLLGIDNTYDFQTMIGSVNFIGGDRVQHPEVPITKLWHLISMIQSTRSLGAVLNWLRTRNYLPHKDRDYKIEEVKIQSGKWRSRWYGIMSCESRNVLADTSHAQK
jgi:hypothetical protein